jgi:hypothetical protein
MWINYFLFFLPQLIKDRENSPQNTCHIATTITIIVSFATFTRNFLEQQQMLQFLDTIVDKHLQETERSLFHEIISNIRQSTLEAMGAIEYLSRRTAQAFDPTDPE